MRTMASRVTPLMPTPHHPGEAPRQATEQDVPLPGQPVLGRNGHSRCHRPGEYVGLALPHAGDEGEEYGRKSEVETPARRILHRAAEGRPDERGRGPDEGHQEPAAEQERRVAAPLVE